MSIKNLYSFKESRFTSLSHELRVYIFGADVTPWLKGDLSVTYGNRDSFNTTVFELANPRKVWQITRDNLKGKWRKDVGEYSEREKLDVFRWKNNPIINPAFNLDISSAVLGNTDMKGSSKFAGAEKYVSPPDNAERRFRFAVNDCIFSRTDPMRIFMRNPYGSTSDEWVEIFCGFVQDHPITTNYLTGESTVRISGVCIRQLLTKMRSQMNRLVNHKDPAPRFESGFFSDFLDPSAAKHPFAGRALEKVIKKLIIGTETPKTGEIAGSFGVGEFRMGNVVCYNPKTPVNTLERWHLMTLFGVNKVPFPNSAADDLWLTQHEMNSLGKSTIILPDQYSQGPGGRYLHFLLPWEGTGAGALVQSGIEESNFRAVEWTTRWEIIRDFASKLDFQVTTSPSGDILVEFPMYGFTPHVFTTQGGKELLPTFNYVETPETQAEKAGIEHTSDLTITDIQLQAQKEYDEANAASVAQFQADIDSGTIPYGLGALLTFELHQIEDTVNDEAEDHVTVLQVDGGQAAEAFEVPGDGVLTALRAFVYSPLLVERFGVITEQMSIPFAAQRPSETAGGASGVLATRLAKLATIEFMKRMADASTWDGSVVFRPFLFPNRPVWLKRSSRIGLVTSVTNRWSIGKSASTNFSMHMLMAERFDPVKNKTEFRLPTGSSNMPISYKSLWGAKEAGNEDETADQFSGIRAQVGTKNPPTKDANGGDGSVGSGTTASDKGQESRSGSGGGGISGKDFKNNPNMYKPFVEAMDAAFKKAAELGYKIKVNSTYRSPQQQQDMKVHPEKWGVKKLSDGRYVPVGAAWGSLHQYGMAMDISIDGGSREDYRKFAEIAGGNIQWGDIYGGDYIHYEWKVRNGRDQMNNFRKSQGWSTQNYPSDYLKKTWDHVDSKTNLSASKSAPEGATAWWESLNPFTPDKPLETGTKSAETAEVCSPARLSQSGLSAIQDLANRIARATRGG